MGCDIHLRAERQRPDGLWEPVLEPTTTCRACAGTALAADRTEACSWCTSGYRRGGGVYAEDGYWQIDRRPAITSPGIIYDSWYDDRDYDVFAVLADVRNYNDVTPIDEPRGLPDDLHPDTREWANDDGDAHSTSWLTLTEIFEAPYSAALVDRFIPAMLRLQEAAGDRPVRIIFFFDN